MLICVIKTQPGRHHKRHYQRIHLVLDKGQVLEYVSARESLEEHSAFRRLYQCQQVNSCMSLDHLGGPFVQSVYIEWENSTRSNCLVGLITTIEYDHQAKTEGFAIDYSRF